MSIDPATTAAAATPAAPSNGPPPVKAFNDDDGPSFSDVLDILNPLQHIPIINTLYQHLTGDTEGAVADVAGGTLWAGPIGLAGSLIDLAVKGDTGKSISDNILSWLGFEDDDSGVAVADAANTPAAAPTPVQQQQAVAAAPPAVTVQALSPLPVRQRTPYDQKDSERRSADSKGDTQDGPIQMGDYLVFGAAGSGQPMALAPAQPVAAATPAAGQVGRQGDYLVFGAFQQQQQQQQAAPMPLASNAPAAPAMTQLAAAAAPAPGNNAPAALTPPQRTFAIPARRNQVTPNALPQPTTGPAAIPGHGPSQAQPTPTVATDSSWFVNAVNSGLDKYMAAQKLGGEDNTPAAAEAGATLH